MIVSIDKDVEKVISFMLSEIPASKLVAVAQALNDLSPLLWGHFPRENINTIEIKSDPILPD